MDCRLVTESHGFLTSHMISPKIQILNIKLSGFQINPVFGCPDFKCLTVKCISGTESTNIHRGQFVEGFPLKPGNTSQS